PRNRYKQQTDIIVTVALYCWFDVALSWSVELISVLDVGQIYRDIIWQYIHLFLGEMGASFVVKDDNAHHHRANVLYEYLEEGDINRLEWPAFFSCLNLVEHGWDTLGLRIAAPHLSPISIPELRIELIQE
ncbi:hypothetical protein AVEN_88141-1, partial [Araneus ventricosus]